MPCSSRPSRAAGRRSSRFRTRSRSASTSRSRSASARSGSTTATARRSRAARRSGPGIAPTRSASRSSRASATASTPRPTASSPATRTRSPAASRSPSATRARRRASASPSSSSEGDAGAAADVVLGVAKFVAYLATAVLFGGDRVPRPRLGPGRGCGPARGERGVRGADAEAARARRSRSAPSPRSPGSSPRARSRPAARSPTGFARRSSATCSGPGSGPPGACGSSISPCSRRWSGCRCRATASRSPRSASGSGSSPSCRRSPGHPGVTDPRALSLAASVVHVGAFAVWAGGLVALLAAFPAATRELAGAEKTALLAGVVGRFSARRAVERRGAARDRRRPGRSPARGMGRADRHRLRAGDPRQGGAARLPDRPRGDQPAADPAAARAPRRVPAPKPRARPGVALRRTLTRRGRADLRRARRHRGADGALAGGRGRAQARSRTRPSSGRPSSSSPSTRRRSAPTRSTSTSSTARAAPSTATSRSSR